MKRSSPYAKSLPYKKRKLSSIQRARNGDLTPGPAPRKYFSRAEQKFKDVNETTAITSTATITLLNGMVQGDTVSTREGRKIIIKSIYLRSRQTLDSNATDSALSRTMLVYDKQANASAPSITDILTSASVQAFNNLDNRERFVVLMDKVIQVKSEGQFISTNTFFKKYMKVNLETIYNSSNVGTVADINTGSLYLVQLGTQAVTADVDNFTNVRIRYVDY